MSFDLTHVLVGAALLLAAFVKGATGLGFPLIATPMVVLSSTLKVDFTISPRGEKILSPIFGFLSGFLNGLTNAAGPTLAIYLYSLKLDKRTFVKSIATIFVTTKLSQLVAISTWNASLRSRK